MNKYKRYKSGLYVDGKLFVQSNYGNWIELKLAAMAEKEEKEYAYQ